MPSYKLRRYGTIKPLKNWYAFYSEGRRSKSWSTGTTDKGLADKRASAYLSDLYAERDAKPGDVSLRAVLSRYQDEKGIGSPSQKANDTAMRGFLTFFGDDATVADLTLSNHIAYEKHCRTKLGQMASTINKRRNMLIAALNHAVKSNVLASAPHVPILPTPMRKERSLSRDEAAKLIRASRRACAHHLTLFIRIAIYTGARASAILQLTWDQVDLHTGRIDFRVPGEVETKKRRPNAPINFILLRALRAARKKTNSTHVIVYRGGPIGLIRKGFLDACRAANLKGVSPHTLKHTAITWLLRRGLTPWQVYGITNTSVATILRVYGHHVQDDLRLAVNAAVGKSAELVPNGQNKHPTGNGSKAIPAGI
jgi:integrase